MALEPTPTTGTVEPRIYDLRSSISPGDLGNIPQVVASIAEGDKSPKVLGIIIGRCAALSFRDNPHGEMPSVALKGQFEFVPADASQINLRAPLLYLPTNVQQLFLAAVMKSGEKLPDKPKRGQSIDVNGNEVEISVQMGVRRHPSPIGYQYIAMMVEDAKMVDPLNDQRAKALAAFGRKPLMIADRRLPIAENRDAGVTTQPPAKAGARK